MKKEIIICCVVVVVIIILNIITQKHTDKVMDEITQDLDGIRQKLISQNKENLEEDMQSTLDKWMDKSEGLAYYVEHDELEKIELYIREITSNIETKEYNIAVQSLDSCKFIISHTKEKYKFSFQNIF